MARVHRLQHVQRFFAADFADHDSIGTHTQAIDQQFALADRAVAFDVRRARFEPRDVRLLQLQFGRVFDGDDAFFSVNERRERVEQRRLTGAGPAGDDDVQLRLDARFEQLHHAWRERFALDQVGGHQLVGGKSADREQRPVDRKRRNDRVDARSVREARVDHRRRFVDAASHLRNDFVDDAQ